MAIVSKLFGSFVVADNLSQGAAADYSGVSYDHHTSDDEQFSHLIPFEVKNPSLSIGRGGVETQGKSENISRAVGIPTAFPIVETHQNKRFQTISINILILPGISLTNCGRETIMIPVTGTNNKTTQTGDRQMTANKYITISTSSDAWGDTTSAPDFNVRDEVAKIRDAAESAGVEVLTDESPRTMYNDDGSERDAIDWWSTWCNVGYEWRDSQWRQFFADNS